MHLPFNSHGRKSSVRNAGQAIVGAIANKVFEYLPTIIKALLVGFLTIFGLGWLPGFIGCLIGKLIKKLQNLILKGLCKVMNPLLKLWRKIFGGGGCGDDDGTCKIKPDTTKCTRGSSSAPNATPGSGGGTTIVSSGNLGGNLGDNMVGAAGGNGGGGAGGNGGGGAGGLNMGALGGSAASTIPEGKDFGCGKLSGQGKSTCSGSTLSSVLGGCETDYQAHHILPCAVLKKSSAAKNAVALGFRFNADFNGWCLPNSKDEAIAKSLPMHCGWDGCHKDYNTCAKTLMDDLDLRRRRGKVNDCQLCGEIDKIITKLESALSNRRVWLNNNDPGKGTTWACPSP